MGITASGLRSALLATPLSNEGVSHMGQTKYHKSVSIKDFLHDCYIEPDFSTTDGYFDEDSIDLNKHQDFDLFTSEGFNQADYIHRSLQRRESFIKEKFETNLLGFNKLDLEHRTFSTVFMIEGPAGCGKTTYGLKLLQEGFEYDYLNIENATLTSFTILGKRFDLSEDRHPVVDPIMALQGLLIGLISNILNKHREENNKKHMKYINDICTTYSKYFLSEEITALDIPEYRIFFDFLRDYGKTGDYEKFGSDSCEYFGKLINECMKNDALLTEREGSVPSIRSLLGIIMRLYYCISKLNDPRVKRVLFLDNFERFIMSEVGRPYVNIYDIHLQKILSSLYEEAGQFEDFLYTVYREFAAKGIKEEYVTTFGIMIALREATLTQLRKNHIFARHYEIHRAEHSPTYVNLANAFNFKKIIDRKINYFIFNRVDDSLSDVLSESEFSKDCSIAFEAIQNILGDKSVSKWALRNLVLDMFNNNYRKFVLNLIEAIIEKEENFVVFNSLWKAANVRGMDRNYLKNICRKLVIRSILDFIQNFKLVSGSKGFFDDLFAKHLIGMSEKQWIKSTYYRHILTYLHNASISNRDNLSNFPSLIKSLLHRPYLREEEKEDINTDDFADISTVLEIACETAKIKTNGDELIYINLDPYLDPENLEDRMKRIWKIYLDSKKKDNQQELHNLKITYAGSVFAMLCPCFEFFACRYKPNSVPLILLKKEDDRKRLLFGNGRFIKGIASTVESEDDVGIVERAFKCVDVAIAVETNLLCKTKSDSGYVYEKPEWIYKDKDLPPEKKGMVHPLRILIEHRNYLINYKRFLAECADDSFENSFYKSGYEGNPGVIDIAIKRYSAKIASVIEKHKDYVNLGILPDKNDYNQ